MKKLVMFALAFICSLVVFSAEPGKKNFIIGMSQCTLTEPWRVQMNAEIKQEAERHPELKIIFKDAQNDTLKQASQVKEFINSGVDLIIISPKETAPLTGPVAEAFDAGIPVIVIDRRVLGDKYTCYIGSDNKLLGKAAGEWARKALGGKGNVVEMKGLMTSTPGQDRHSGFMEAIKGSDIKIIFDADTKWMESLGRSEMESALARFNDINLVYGHNDSAAHGAFLAAKAADREKNILFVGIDGLPQEGQAYVKQGYLDASILNKTGGNESVRIALDILNGKKVEKEVILGSKIFTKNNIDKGGEDLKF